MGKDHISNWTPYKLSNPGHYEVFVFSIVTFIGVRAHRYVKWLENLEKLPVQPVAKPTKTTTTETKKDKKKYYSGKLKRK